MELEQQLVHLIQQAWTEEQTLAANLPPEVRAAAGQPGQWAAKDYLAHLANWKERATASLAAAARGEPWTAYPNFEELNASDFERYRHWSWEQVLEKGAAACRQMVDQLEAIDDAILLGGEPPLWRRIVGNCYTHSVLMHLSQLYRECGDPESVARLQEQGTELMGRMDDDPAWQGLVRYNLACYYALSARPAQAITTLTEALQLNPGLSNWAQQDPDLLALHDEPHYQALFAGDGGQ